MAANPHLQTTTPSAADQFTKGADRFLGKVMGTVEGGLTGTENVLGLMERDLGTLLDSARDFQGMLSDHGLAKAPSGWTGTSKHPKTQRLIGKFVATPFGRQTLKKILQAILSRGPGQPKEPEPTKPTGGTTTGTSETDRMLRGNKRRRKRKGG